ncbi:hypothetical protein LCGC14_1817140 [marine sediment metagenome]|uniref:Uncharacterized protein n=1 Tax=marine sediment metagenome TaxID=412755 RepID=A0A0F9JJJ3_9ZZZZ|nr:hypothetical protein [bacterium]
MSDYLKDEEYKLDSCFQESTCFTIQQKENEIEGLKNDLQLYKEEVSTKYKNFGSIKRDLSEIKEAMIEVAHVFQNIKNTPIYNYIRKRVKIVNKIFAVLLNSKEKSYDLWFIIEENKFQLKHQISGIFCDIAEIFNSIYFDLLILDKNRINFNKIKNECESVIYIKSD